MINSMLTPLFGLEGEGSVRLKDVPELLSEGVIDVLMQGRPVGIPHPLHTYEFIIPT